MGTVEIRRCVYAKAETSAVNRDIGRFALKFWAGRGTSESKHSEVGRGFNGSGLCVILLEGFSWSCLMILRSIEQWSLT